MVPIPQLKLPMDDSELTLSSPLSTTASLGRPLLALTILWHADLTRVGEQYIAGTSAQTLQVSRYLPLFCRPGGDGLALGHGGVSREPVQIVRDSADNVTVRVPISRMVVELNGIELADTAVLSLEQVEAGAVLALGRSILICIHWMTCLPRDNCVSGLLGVGSAAIQARDAIHLAASADAPVLLLGETGTGKEVAARAIHAIGKRSSNPFVAVNMAVLNESLAAADLFGATRGAYTGAQVARNGLFAQAQDGTLFLDEIGNSPASVQPMLLRVLESGDYRPLGAQHDLRTNARLIAATDQDMYSSSFNQPLLRRLEGFVIRLPNLEARREDIGVLIAHFLNSNELARESGVMLSPAFVSACANYDWPGNIRQLGHVIKRAIMTLAQGGQVSFDALIDQPRPSSPVEVAPPSVGWQRKRRRLSDVSEQDVLAAMESNNWYIQAAALALGVSRPSMYKLIEVHPQIQVAALIAPDDLRAALAASGGKLEACASLLKTPSEALRRHLGALGLLA